MSQQITGIKKHAFSSSVPRSATVVCSAKEKGPEGQQQPLATSGFASQKNPMSFGFFCEARAVQGRRSFAAKSKAQFKITQATNGTIQNSYSKEIELNRRYFIVGERRISSYWWASVFFVGGFGFLITGISSYIKYNLFTSVVENVSSLIIGIIGAANEVNPQVFLESEGTGALASLRAGPLVGGESLVFFPQGLLMCFYGSLGLLLSVYWWLLIYWNVGGGFNEFNKKEGFMRIFRWGYPGKNRRIDIVYSLKDIEAIRVELKQSQGLLASEQTIFVRLLSLPAIPFTSSATSTAPIFSNSQNESVGKLKEKREIPLGGIGQPLTLKEIEKQASELANYLQVALEGL